MLISTLSDESFLPQIVGLFYATFDPVLGPTVLHQVPDHLITSTSVNDDTSSRSTSRSRERGSSKTRGRSVTRSLSPGGPALSTLPTLLDFTPISDYVIPKKSLHGKLVTLLTTGVGDGDGGREREQYRVMGYPCVLTGEGGRYQRNEYMWNLCFVFHSSSSLEAMEPVVRKCGRILRSAELDSGYLSAPLAEHTPLPAVLEQLFEDLNSYSETSIPLDGFNSMELKIFPFFPNPPDCEDWHVPIALVDFKALKDDNWDITASRVTEYIDGVNHVKRIAQLADADEALTRETLRHLLYYQVIMMVDIFQYSNMYTLKPSITRLAALENIIAECGPYVVRSPHPHPPWPVLLRLYSKLLPGTTVHDWIEANDIISLGIDPRRFVSFGIIKGFLRRVHRWPILIERGSPLLEQPESRRRVGWDKATRVGSSMTLSTKAAGDSALTRSGPGDSTFTLRSQGSNVSLGVSPGRTPSSLAKSPRRPPQIGFTSVNVRGSLTRSTNSGGDTHPSMSSKRGTLKSGALKIREEQSRRMEQELVGYLSGAHHADEIQVRFGISWEELEKLLGLDEIKDGKGKKGVSVIYR